MNKIFIFIFFITNFIGIYSKPYDIKWIKSGGNQGTQVVWDPIVSNTNKYFIFMEPYGTHLIDYKTGDLKKIYSNSLPIKQRFDDTDSLLYKWDNMFRIIDIKNDSVIYSNFDKLEGFGFINNGPDLFSLKYLSDVSVKYNLYIHYVGSLTNIGRKYLLFCNLKDGKYIDSVSVNNINNILILEKNNQLLYSNISGLKFIDINSRKVTKQLTYFDVRNLTKSHDENLIAFHSFTNPYNPILHIIDANNFSHLFEQSVNNLNIINNFYSSFSHDGKNIAIYNNNAIEIYNIAKSKLIRTFKTILVPNYISFCDSDSSLVVTNEETGITINYDIESGLSKNTLVVNDDEISLLKFSPSGKYLLIYGKNRDWLKVINTNDGNLEKVIKIENPLNDKRLYHFDINDSIILFSNYENEYLFYNINNNKSDYIQTNETISDVVLSSDGNKYAISSINGNVFIKSIIDNSLIFHVNLDENLLIYKICFSINGNLIFIFGKLNDRYILYQWDFYSKPTVLRNDFITNIDESKYIDFINHCYLSTRDFIYNIEKNNYCSIFPGYIIGGMDISKDDKKIAFGQIYPQGDYEFFDIYSLDSKNILKSFKIKDFIDVISYDMELKHYIIPHCVAFSPDNKYIAVGLYNGTLMMINNDTLETYVYDISSLDDKIITYPNPFDDKINIQIKGIDDELLKIELFDIFNTKIYELSDFDSINNSSFTLNTSSFSSGVYFLQLTFRHGKYLKKIVNIK
jgi:hypothetical protein